MASLLVTAADAITGDAAAPARRGPTRGARGRRRDRRGRRSRRGRRRSARRRRAAARLEPARDGARHGQHAQPQLPVAAARHRRRPAVPRVARQGALSLLAAARRRGHGDRGAVRVRRDAAPRRHHRLRLLLPQRAGQRPRVARRSRPRAGSASASCSRAASTTGTARPPRIARPSRRRSRTSRRCTRATAIRARHLVTVQPAPHSQHGATPEMIDAGAGCARDAGAPWHIHLAEEKYQVDAVAASGSARGRCTRSTRCRSTCRR